MTVKRATCGIMLLLASVSGQGAETEQALPYREAPTVLPSVRPAPASDRRLDRLSTALSSSAAPRVALFWDRDVSEETHSSYRSITSRRESSSHDGFASAEATYGRGDAPDRTTYEGEGHRSKQVDTIRSEERVKEASAPMDQTEVFVETRVKEHLGAAGVKFVSAAMATRLAAMQDASERPDRNKAEMKGLTKDADYLLKIEPTFSTAKGAPSYRVTMTSLRSSQQLLDFVTDAKPEQSAPAKKKFVATAKGYELAPPGEEVTLKEHARELALQIADRMATALAAR